MKKKKNAVMLITLLFVIVVNTNQQPAVCYGECSNSIDFTVKFI